MAPRSGAPGMPIPSQLDRLVRRPAFQGIALFVLTLLVFIPAMSGGFIWDDDITLTNNPMVKLSFTEGIPYIWFSSEPTDYYPVTWSSFWFEWRLWGRSAPGYHVTNILLHGLATVLLWRILLRLPLPGGPATAFATALLFGIHPLCVDSVAWISQRKNTLSIVFYLLAALGFLRHSDGGRARDYWLALLAFALGLLSKSSIIALPAVLACLEWYRGGDRYLKALRPGIPVFSFAMIFSLIAFWLMLQGMTVAAIIAILTGLAPILFTWKKSQKSQLLRLVPFFLLALAGVFLTLWFQGKVLGYGIESGNDAAQTVLGELESSLSGQTPLGERLIVMGQIYWFYFFKILVPTGVSMVYETWDPNPFHAVHYLPTIFMVAAVIVPFLFRKKIGRGLCAAMVYLGLSLSPVLGLFAMSFQNYSWVANHLAYLGVPGVTVLLAGSVAWLAGRLREKSPLAASSGWAAVAAVSLVYAAQTWTRAGYYQAPENLWIDNIKKSPDAEAAYNELGIVYYWKRDYEKAVEAFERCVNVDPTFNKPHNNMGSALVQMGELDRAIRAFERSLEINPYDPDALGNLGLMYYKNDEPEKAIAIFERTLEHRLMSPATYHNMGLALAELGRKEEAIRALNRAIAMNPDQPVFYGVAGEKLYELKEFKLALEYLLEGMDMGGIYAPWANTAAFIMATSQDPALRDGERALELILAAEAALETPEAATYITKAAVLAELGRFEEADRVLAPLETEAEAKGAEELLKRIRTDRKRYRAGQPSRQVD